MLNQLLLCKKLSEFLEEDLEKGDMSAQFLGGQHVTGFLIAKQTGVISGQQIPQTAYDLLGGAKYAPLVAEGAMVERGSRIGKVSGDAATILSAERVVLNLMQRMSGISTAAKKAIETLGDPTIKITDTRKTVPGLRMFDKYAVTVGGGTNHRFGLTGGVMLKDNHIALMGGVKDAVRAIQARRGPLSPIEVEVESLSELKEAIAAKADVIMFDNQDPKTVSEWAKITPDDVITEVSGGITSANIASYRNCGADFISLGYLTNDVTPIDISFLVEGTYKAEKI